MCKSNSVCYFCGSQITNFERLNNKQYSLICYYVISCPVCGKYCVHMDYKYYYNNFRDEAAFYLYYFNKLYNVNNKIIIFEDSTPDGKLSSNEIIKLKENGYKFVNQNAIKSIYPIETKNKLDYLIRALNKIDNQTNTKIEMTIEELATACLISKVYRNITMNKDTKQTVEVLEQNDAWNKIQKYFKYLKDENLIEENYKKNGNIIKDIELTIHGKIEAEKIKYFENENQKDFINEKNKE